MSKMGTRAMAAALFRQKSYAMHAIAFGYLVNLCGKDLDMDSNDHLFNSILRIKIPMILKSSLKDLLAACHGSTGPHTAQRLDRCLRPPAGLRRHGRSTSGHGSGGVDHLSSKMSPDFIRFNPSFNQYSSDFNRFHVQPRWWRTRR